MARPGPTFDGLTGLIDAFVREGRASEIWADEGRRLDEGLVAGGQGRPSRRRALAAVDAAFAAAEARFEELARAHSVELLFATLRRFPLSTAPHGWLQTVTLGLEKYGTLDDDARMVDAPDAHALRVTADANTIPDAFRLARVAERMCHFAGMRRWIGKGASVRAAETGWQVHAPDDVEEAVALYEARRPGRLFADRGILFADKRVDDTLVLFLLPSPLLVYYYVPERDLHLKANYLPHLGSATQVHRVLQAYQEVIEHSNPPLRIDDVPHVLTAVTHLCLSTLRLPSEAVGEDRWVLEPESDAVSAAHKLGFTFGLFQTGYLRRSKEKWVEEIARVRTPWAPDPGASAAAATRFLDAFAVTLDRRDEIDLATLRPHPLVFVPSSGGYYFDQACIGQWLEALVEDAQLALESQHGDRFEFATRVLLEEALGKEAVTGKWTYTDENGRRIVGDIAVVFDTSIYCIECKAFRKSAGYFRGDPEAIRSHASRIDTALKQARRASEAVRSGRSELGPLGTRRVVPVVCTPSQEFLRPPDRTGWLAPGVPTVCTPEELVDVLVSARETSSP